ncbi:MAG: hypothetical protein ABI693_33610 [Bryobacteraceae bacterium]
MYGSAGDFDVFDVQSENVSTAYGDGSIVDRIVTERLALGTCAKEYRRMSFTANPCAEFRIVKPTPNGNRKIHAAIPVEVTTKIVWVDLSIQGHRRFRKRCK